MSSKSKFEITIKISKLAFKFNNYKVLIMNKRRL